MERGILRLQDDAPNVHYRLVDMLYEYTGPIKILQISSERFDFFDLTLLNEIADLPSIEDLQLYHISIAKGLVPAIAQVSPLHELKKLTLNCAFTAEMLRAVASPKLEYLGLHGTAITHEIMDAVKHLPIVYLDFTSSEVESLSGVMKAFPRAKTITLNRATVMDILLLTAYFDEISILQTTLDGFQPSFIQQLRKSAVVVVDECLRVGGYGALMKSAELKNDFYYGLADFALETSELESYLDAHIVHSEGRNFVFWFQLYDEVYTNWGLLSLKGEVRYIKSLTALPDEGEKDYFEVIKNLAYFIDFRRLERLGLGLQEPMRAWTEEYAAQSDNLVLRFSDYKKAFRGRCKVLVQDDFMRTELKPYVARRRNALE